MCICNMLLVTELTMLSIIYVYLHADCIMWMMLDVIPDEFGRNNTRITLGIISFIAGASEVGSAYAKG